MNTKHILVSSRCVRAKNVILFRACVQTKFPRRKRHCLQPDEPLWPHLNNPRHPAHPIRPPMRRFTPRLGQRWPTVASVGDSFVCNTGTQNTSEPTQKKKNARRHPFARPPTPKPRINLNRLKSFSNSLIKFQGSIH